MAMTALNSAVRPDVLSGVRDRGLPSTSLSDEALLEGMGLGERAAASAFVKRFQARVYGLALSIVGDPLLAEDLAQEALTKAWHNAGAYDPRRGAVATWLLTITRNLAIDALRLHRARPFDPHPMLTFDIPSRDPGPAGHDSGDVGAVGSLLLDLHAQVTSLRHWRWALDRPASATELRGHLQRMVDGDGEADPAPGVEPHP